MVGLFWSHDVTPLAAFVEDDLNVLLRRVAFEVRRDAAQTLSNGRIIYDALFTRTGFQSYPRRDGGT